MMKIDKSKIKVKDLLYRLASVRESDKNKVSVRSAHLGGCIRFVLYWEITENDVEAVIDKLRLIVNEFNDNDTMQ